ncbi:hypothetical protein OIDMADRAFT_62279 [Oidiodendron maius Zn]|uniref:Uncharacterized protein n=1 Tax=Oidiodendron maius (strain Zn) TaxID=913774 RepID=A0A0C3GMH3_OIDMZ|nr:hypothetical protein OIDMADRAFT_62279 [Oidiodendron maius Zn]
MALGAGPVTAFAVGSRLASWVGYEIIFGAVVRFGGEDCPFPLSYLEYDRYSVSSDVPGAIAFISFTSRLNIQTNGACMTSTRTSYLGMEHLIQITWGVLEILDVLLRLPLRALLSTITASISVNRS